MFTASLPPIEYRDPWTQPVEDRVRALLRRADHRVAYLYERPDTSTFRYRIYNMVQALEDDPGIAASWFTRLEIPRLLPLLDRCDSLVVCRTRYCEQVAHLLAYAHSRGVTTIFDCDDLVFDPNYVHLVLHTLDQPLFPQAWDHWFAMVGRLNATLRLCERAIVTNDFLAGRMRACAPDKDVRVVPNFLDREQLDVSLRLHEAKRNSGFARDDRIHIGYFSGTPTHSRDFAIISDALVELLRSDPRVVLRLVGFLDPGSAFAEFSDRIERFPLQDFLNLQRLIAGVEFNVVPLQQNDFTNSKSELKYFEAAIVGTVTLASPTFAFRNAIRDGENGYLVPSFDWLGALRTAIETAETYPAMAQRAYTDARARYSPKAMARLIRDALLAPPTQAQRRSSAPSAPPTGSEAGRGAAAIRRSASA
jgi:glycosyltransferase involved in cell wall biosynthesis